MTALLYLGVYLLAQGLSAALFLGIALLMILRDAPGLNGAALINACMASLREHAISVSLFSNLVTLGALALAARLKKRTLADACGLTPVPFERLWPLLPLGVSLNGLLTTLISLLPAGMLADYTDASAALLSQTGLLPLLAVAFLGPVTEEVLFRGLLYRNLSNSIPPVAAALITSAAFGLLHGQIVWMAYAFIAGLLFCLAVSRYGSLLGGLLLHMCFNLSGGFSAALSLLPPAWALLLSAGVCAASLLLALWMTRKPAQS